MASSACGSIVGGPQNDALYYGPAVVLQCEASSAAARVTWAEYASNAAGAPISDGEFVLPGHPNAARYTILHPTDTVYDLQISPTELTDGGRYKCQDANEGDPTYAELVMIESEPVCSTNIPDSGYVREDQYYSAECVVNYRGNAAPVVTWSGPPADYFQSSTTTNVTVWGGVAINMTRFMSNYRYNAHLNFTVEGFEQPNSAVNVPTWNYTYSTPLLYVEWAPTKMYIVPDKPSYEIGEMIECHADANPVPKYFLQNLDTNEYWFDYRLVISDRLVGTSEFRCNARNNISNTIYVNDLFFTLTVNPRTSTPVPTTTTVTTTTAPPAEAPCDDLTGRWTATDPHAVDLCLEVNNTNYGRIVGIMRNASDPFFIEVRGRVAPNKYNQVGFTGIWPTNIGAVTFTGICKKCYGVEKLQLNAIGRRVTDNESCENVGPSINIPYYLFLRTGPPCGMNMLAQTKQRHTVVA